MYGRNSLIEFLLNLEQRKQHIVCSREEKSLPVSDMPGIATADKYSKTTVSVKGALRQKVR